MPLYVSETYNKSYRNYLCIMRMKILKKPNHPLKNDNIKRIYGFSFQHNNFSVPCNLLPTLALICLKCIFQHTRLPHLVTHKTRGQKTIHP